MPSITLKNWTFLDYVSINGENKISVWLQSIPLKARVEFEAMLDVLKGKERLERPQTGKLTRECKGLYEIRFKSDNVQYRPLFIYGPDTQNREVTILIGATKNGKIWDPPSACRTAHNRAGEIAINRRQVVRHVRVN